MKLFRRRESRHHPRIELQLAEPDEVNIPNLVTMADLKHRQQRVEWRQRQAHYEHYGVAPGPTIIRAPD